MHFKLKKEINLLCLKNADLSDLDFPRILFLKILLCQFQEI
jgi:hypothetical protein